VLSLRSEQKQQIGNANVIPAIANKSVKIYNLIYYLVWLRTGRPGFDPRQRQRIFPLTSASTPTLGPTHHPLRWVPGALSPGVKRGRGVMLATHPLLVPRLRKSRSYTSSHPKRLLLPFIPLKWDTAFSKHRLDAADGKFEEESSRSLDEALMQHLQSENTRTEFQLRPEHNACTNAFRWNCRQLTAAINNSRKVRTVCFTRYRVLLFICN
jgi:hypothetical protein